MDILLVNPDHGTKNNFPWGTLAVGSYLKNVKNFKVKMLDASVDGEEFVTKQILENLSETKVVGFTSFSSDIPFVKSAIDKIKKSKVKKSIVTDSIDNSNKLKKISKIQVVSISSMMAEAIKRISNSTSVSSLFK